MADRGYGDQDKRLPQKPLLAVQDLFGGCEVFFLPVANGAGAPKAHNPRGWRKLIVDYEFCLLLLQVTSAIRRRRRIGNQRVHRVHSGLYRSAERGQPGERIDYVLGQLRV